MKPRVLRYFCMRVLCHLAGNSGHARQKERTLKWRHNSCNHKHSHSHFAHNPLFFLFVCMPEIRYMSTHFSYKCGTVNHHHVCICLWALETRSLLTGVRSTFHEQTEQHQKPLRKQNKQRSLLLWRKCLRLVRTQKAFINGLWIFS